MIVGNDIFSNPIREIAAKVELSKGSSTKAFTHNGDLVSVTIDRVGAPKFFGYGISQKATINIRDKERQYHIEKDTCGIISFNDTSAFAPMYVSEVVRQENTNALTITLLDALADAANHTISELSLDELESYDIATVATWCAQLLELGGIEYDYPEFQFRYDGGANFSGAETIREVLDAIAEVTQTVYYINHFNELVFRRLSIGGIPDYAITKAQYFTLDSKTDKTLTAIGSITELGDNVEATTGADGEAQYIRNNPFWDMREDIADLVEQALEAVGGLTINQFNVKWRGNYLLEPADKIAIVTKDNDTVYSYLLNDTITYNGGFSQVTNWEYGTEEKVHTNPSTLGEVIKQTYAKVDKANREIELVASEAGKNTSAIAALQLNAESINATVAGIQTATNAATGNIETLTQKVNAQITESDVNLAISNALDNGVNKVETTTGFTFNEAGLRVSNTNSEVSTIITENGMRVEKGSAPMLIANKDGVKAEDLHATTFLIIGKNSRLEDMGNRTACFWIGG